MDSYIITNTGNHIPTTFSLERQGGDLKVIFDFKWDLGLNWDIDQISLLYKSDSIEIITARGNRLEHDNVIGKQLIALAKPLLKEGLFTALSPAEQAQISDFALNAFSRLSGATLQELSSYELIQPYKDQLYIVSFRKHPKSTPNDMEWKIVHIIRKNL